MKKQLFKKLFHQLKIRQLNVFLKLHYKLHLHYLGLHCTAGDS